MRRYRDDAVTAVRIDYGVGLLAGLTAFPETQPLAPPLAKLNDELEAAHTERRARRKALVKARAELRLANYLVDQVIRHVHRAAQAADGGRRGPATGELFPEGLAPAVAPHGGRQIKPTEELVDRFARSKVESVARIGAEWLPRLQPRLTVLRAADDAVKAANDAYVGAFRVEIALRAEHLTHVDDLVEKVRAAVSGDRMQQDVIFPELDVEAEQGEAPAT